MRAAATGTRPALVTATREDLMDSRQHPTPNTSDDVDERFVADLIEDALFEPRPGFEPVRVDTFEGVGLMTDPASGEEGLVVTLDSGAQFAIRVVQTR